MRIIRISIVDSMLLISDYVGSVVGLTGSGGCRLGTRLNGNSLASRGTGVLCAYKIGQTKLY